MEQFIIYAIIGGCGSAILTSLLGNIVLWKRMSYFGDSLAHAALLGVAISLFFEINPFFGPFIVAVFFPLILMWLKKNIDNNAALGIIAQSSLAIAMIVISFMPNVRVDLVSYLFGDILAVNISDIACIYFLLFLEILWLFKNWKKLLLYCTDESLARSSNINVELFEKQFTILLSFIVVVSIKIVGILLITSMLMIPAGASKNIAKSPISMVMISVFIGFAAVIFGIAGSFYFNTPTGPSIIIMLLAFLCGSFIKF